MSNNNSGIPIIRLEIESMKHAISIALNERMLSMDADIQAALDELCTVERIRAEIKQAVDRAIPGEIARIVAGLFHWGPARDQMDEAVKEVVRKAVQRERRKARRP